MERLPIGTTVRLKSKKYFEEMKERYDCYGNFCPASMIHYAGQVYGIVIEHNGTYRLKNNKDYAGDWWYSPDNFYVCKRKIKPPRLSHNVIKAYNIYRNMKNEGFESASIDKMFAELLANPSKRVSDVCDDIIRSMRRLTFVYGVAYILRCIAMGETCSTYLIPRTDEAKRWLSCIAFEM